MAGKGKELTATGVVVFLLIVVAVVAAPFGISWYGDALYDFMIEDLGWGSATNAGASAIAVILTVTAIVVLVAIVEVIWGNKNGF